MTTLKSLLLNLLILTVASCRPANQVADIQTPIPIPAATEVIVSITPTETPPIFHPSQIIASDLTSSADEPLQNAILFFSKAPQPFPNLEFGAMTLQDTFCIGIGAGRCVKTTNFSGEDPQLWAISPDVQSPRDLIVPAAIYLPQDSETQKAIVVENEMGATYTHEKIFNLKLPDECYGILEPDEFPNMPPGQCGGYKFSPDGKYLGFNFGPDICRRGIIILDVQTGEKLYRSEAGVGHWFAFFPNDKVLIATGHCEGGNVHLLNPATRQLTDLGGEGGPNWSPNQNIVMMSSGSYQGSINYIWSYDAEADLYFETAVGLNENETWAPDGNHYLYQNWETLSYDKTLYKYMVGASRIIVIGAVHGTSQIMLSDEQYDYQICEYWHSDCTKGWIGDWIQIKRSPTFEKEYYDLDPFVVCEDKCKGVVYFALNWITGELIPWDEFLVSIHNQIATPTPTSTPISGPKLSSKPIYTHSDNSYSLYVGNDGQSLWYVPQQGEPVLWVESGYDFTYFP